MPVITGLPVTLLDSSNLFDAVCETSATDRQALKDVDKDTLKEVLGNVSLPSWITFPDFERVGWVNDVIDQLWPYVCDAVSMTVRDRLDPMLAENRPAWISSIKLFRWVAGVEYCCRGMV